MKRETITWMVVMFVAGGWLLFRAGFRDQGMGKVYVKEVRLAPRSETDRRTTSTEASPRDDAALVSIPRSAGLWIAAFCTLAVFSFLYRDNALYRFSEAVFVGVTAAWSMVVGFWDGIVDKLLRNLMPGLMRAWALPDIPETAEPNWIYLIPAILGIMLLWRLMPHGAWVARWPLALVVGTFAGLRLVTFLDADFVAQIRNTIVPLMVFTRERFDFWASLRNIATLLGVLSCLTYFFFSVEHRGIVGKVSRVGIWYLMITFGASFAFTVMGRIALLAGRVEFLLDDWLWLIDPAGRRPSDW